MIRFAIRLGFWSALALFAMPNSRAYLANNGFAPQSISSALGLAVQDAGNFCSRNLVICDQVTKTTSEVAGLAKTRMLDAYHGIRLQHQEPDRQIMTGSIKQQSEKP